MNRLFLLDLMEKTKFPAAAQKELTALANKLEAELDRLTEHYWSAKSFSDTDPLIRELSAREGASPYSLWMLVLLLAAERAKPLYRDEGIFYDTFSDLCYKAHECHERYGVWGTFVAHWYPIFYRGNIVKLGRMEYETKSYQGEESVTVMGMTLQPGQTLLSMHIPASGEPFDRRSRMESYRRACDYFGKPLVCVCASWLLYPGYEDVFGEGSNIADFRKEFCLLSHKETERFDDGWRVFGSAWDETVENLPEKTSMQRAFKARLLSGGTVGCGTGVLIFDGETLLSRQEG